MNYEFLTLYEELSKLNSTFLKEETIKEINLSDCRMISSDVTDLRGELETSACIDYNGELTRVQVRTVIIRETENGKEFLAKKFRYRMALPGGGYDVVKDKGDILATAKREAYEEVNLNLTKLEDTKVRTWRHREDPWVQQHVENPDDRWTGYYSYYIVGQVAGTGDNENPEELNQWKWYPITQLEKINKDVYNYVCALTEDWGDGSHGEQDLTIPGKLSYCCENPTNLLKILESGLIKAASVPETHETDVLARKPSTRGKVKFACYPYVSFSKQLFSHAYRRPNKWSFGLVINENSLRGKGYELVGRDHTYNALSFEALFTTEDNKCFMAKTSLYGFVEVSKEIYDIIYEAMLYKSNAMYSSSNDTKIVKGKLNQKDAWKLRTVKASDKSMQAANAHLKNLGFSSKIAYPGSAYHNIQYAVHLKELDAVKPGYSKVVLDYLLNNTYYNEGELRFWCKNNEPGVKFTPADLYGIILPEVVVPESHLEEEISLHPAQNAALTKILEFKDTHNLELFTHKATDASHLSNLGVDRGIKSKGTR